MQNLASTSITFSDGKYWVNSWDENGNWLGADEYHGFDIKMPEITVPKFSGGSSGGSKSSGSDKNDVLDNYLEQAERRYKIHQDETKYINDLDYALSDLVKTEEERQDVLDKIEQARKDYADNQVKDLEHIIEMTQNLKGENADVLEYYDRIQDIAHNEADRLRSIGYDDNSDEVQEWQSKWWDAQQSIVDWRWENSQNWINSIK